MVIALQTQVLCGRLDRQEISSSQFVGECARMIASAIDCSRAGIWMFDDSELGTSLRCLGIFDSMKNRLVMAPDHEAGTIGPYFLALRDAGSILAPDAARHPATASMFNEHLSGNRVQSLMATAFSINGRLFGAFTCTQVDQRREWNRAELMILKRIGSRASLALAEATRTGPVTISAPL